MKDDVLSLQAAWMSDSASGTDVLTNVDAVLARDRAMRARDRRARAGGVVGLSVLIPLLIWAAAYGVTPLVRAAYAMMAFGCGVSVAAEWLFLDWSRQALPGPIDARSQLQKSSFMLARQIRLMSLAPLWSSPIFIGVALIAFWMYRERTHAGALAVAVVTAGAWLAAGLYARSALARLNGQRQQMEHLLNELE